MNVPLPRLPPRSLRRFLTPERLAFPASLLFFLLLYRDVVFGDMFASRRDLLYVYLPTRAHFFHRLANGEFPQWYPFDGLGSGYLANGFTGIFHPLSALHLAFSDATALGLTIAAAHALAFAGAYRLARFWGRSYLAALVSGIAFSMSGYVTSMEGGNLPYLCSAAAIPWAVLGLEAANVPLCAIAMASIAVSGERVHNLWLASALLLALAATNPRRRQALLTIALSAVIAVLLAAPQIVPTLMANPSVSPSESMLADAREWALSPLRVPGILTPGFLWLPGTSSPPNALFSQTDYNSFWADSLHVGAMVLVLAFLGAFFTARSPRTSSAAVASGAGNGNAPQGAGLPRTRERRILALAAAAGLLLSIGTGTSAPFFQLGQRFLPGFSLLRYPEKSFILTAFALPMLASFGIDALLDDGTGKARRIARRSLALIAAALFAMAMAAPSCQGLLLFLASPSGDLEKAGEELRAFMPAFQRDLLFGAALALLSLALHAGFQCAKPDRPCPGAAPRGRSASCRAQAFLLLAALTPFLAVFPLFHEFWSPRSILEVPPYAKKAAEAHPGFAYGRGRIFVPEETLEASLKGLSWDRPFLRFPINSSAAHFGIEGVPGYFPMADGREKTAVELLPERVFLQGFNVGFSLRLERPASARLEDAFHVRKEDAADRVRLVQGVPVSTPQEAGALASAKGFSPFRSVPVEVPEGEGARFAETEAPVDPRLSVLEYSPERLVVDAASDASCFLFVADAFAPGWTATIDGAPTPVYPGLIAGRAVFLPEGSHRIVLTYSTPGMEAALVLGGLGFLLLAAVLLFGSRLGLPSGEGASARP